MSTATSNVDDVRCNQLWRERGDHWVCGVCSRYKAEIIRPDRSGVIFGQIHLHHDHMSEFTNNLMQELLGKTWSHQLHAKFGAGFSHFQNNFDQFLTRFARTEMCMDCNDADPKAKRAVDADRWFSFSPKEIRSFIKPVLNRPPEIDGDIAKQIYDCQIQSHEQRKRLGILAVKRIIAGRYWSA